MRSSSTEFAPSFTLTWNPDKNDGASEGVRFAVGLLHLEGHSGSLDLSTQDFLAPLTAERTTDYVHTGFHLGFSAALSHEWSLGATYSTTYSDLSVSEPLEIPVGSFSGMSPLGTPWGELLFKNFGVRALRIPGSFESDPVLGGALTLGALWKPSEEFQWGASIRTQLFEEDYEGRVDVDITRIFGEPDPVTFPDGFVVAYDGRLSGLDHPTVVSLGVAWRPDPCIRLGMDVRWTGWRHSRRQLEIELREGNNPGFNAFVGGDRLNVNQSFDWDNQWTVALGVEWQFHEQFTMRAGGFLQENPIKNASVNPSAPAFATAGFSLGLGFQGESLSVDVAWMHVFPAESNSYENAISSDLDLSKTRVATDIVQLTVTLRF
jgi:hypothetical protein